MKTIITIILLALTACGGSSEQDPIPPTDEVRVFVTTAFSRNTVGEILHDVEELLPGQPLVNIGGTSVSGVIYIATRRPAKSVKLLGSMPTYGASLQAHYHTLWNDFAHMAWPYKEEIHPGTSYTLTPVDAKQAQLIGLWHPHHWFNQPVSTIDTETGWYWIGLWMERERVVLSRDVPPITLTGVEVTY